MIIRSWICLSVVSLSCNNSRHVVDALAFVAEQCSMVLYKRWLCCAAGKVAAGLAQSNGGLPLGLWLSHLPTDCLPGDSDQLWLQHWPTFTICNAAVACRHEYMSTLRSKSVWLIVSSGQTVIYHITAVCGATLFICDILYHKIGKAETSVWQ